MITITDLLRMEADAIQIVNGDDTPWDYTTILCLIYAKVCGYPEADRLTLGQIEQMLSDHYSS